MGYNTYLDNIERKLKHYFDIQRNYIVNDYKYDLFAEYHMRSERYIALKKAVIYAMEDNEYCFINYFDQVNISRLEEYTKSLINSIDTLVDPNENHMSSIITGVIVLEEKPEDEITREIKTFKYHKGFAFGLKGWVDIRLILVAMEDKYIVTNKKGREVREVYSV